VFTATYGNNISKLIVLASYNMILFSYSFLCLLKHMKKRQHFF